jgi:hypothetical protein
VIPKIEIKEPVEFPRFVQLLAEEPTQRAVLAIEQANEPKDITADRPVVKLHEPKIKNIPLLTAPQEKSTELEISSLEPVLAKTKAAITKGEQFSVKPSIESEESRTGIEESPLTVNKDLMFAEIEVSAPASNEVTGFSTQDSTLEQIDSETNLEELVLNEIEEFTAAIQEEQSEDSTSSFDLRELFSNSEANSDIAETVTEIIKIVQEIRLEDEVEDSNIEQLTEDLRVLCEDLLTQLGVTLTPENTNRFVRQFIKKVTETTAANQVNSIEFMEEGTHEQKFSSTTIKHYPDFKDDNSEVASLLGRFALRIRPFTFGSSTS